MHGRYARKLPTNSRHSSKKYFSRRADLEPPAPVEDAAPPFPPVTAPRDARTASGVSVVPARRRARGGPSLRVWRRVRPMTPSTISSRRAFGRRSRPAWLHLENQAGRSVADSVGAVVRRRVPQIVVGRLALPVIPSPGGVRRASPRGRRCSSQFRRGACPRPPSPPSRGRRDGRPPRRRRGSPRCANPAASI